MKRFSLVLILLLIMPSFSSAEWVMLPLEELVCDTEMSLTKQKTPGQRRRLFTKLNWLYGRRQE